ncbi:mechanosensitive ion channel domain-containing protein [Rhodoferax sp.]|uniref:mechanosensitive ion channel family protein n=1 Tax=Rhodoferax sp. TaxID=50421 RepID=UPI00260C6B21|nr:mechanosensitive ion channel domain-containing protein [Rhodoferax sp.]MDD2919439.1 mechanosensitive ion channel [Rhodoferax sp.]
MSEPAIADLSGWLAALSQTSVLIELGALLACALLAWQLARLVSQAFPLRELNSIMFGRRIVDGVLFPALLLCLAYAARKLLAYSMPLALFKLAIPVLISLLVIRLGVKVLQSAFNDTPAIRLLERSISWIAWAAMVLWVSGLLPLVMEELDQISWRVGGATLSVRKIIEGTLTAGLVLIISLWISSAIEAKLLRSATGGELSLRKAFSNAARALLMFVGLLLALSAVGIDLTALSVLGGAIGVGIGFGLQKLAANYVSGFVILAERSMRIGDSVQVDNFSGVITEINARYTVIRSLNGRESIVPNEMLITSRVENLSLADPKVWQSTNVSVAYDSDVELVSRLLLQAAAAQQRVLAEPGPAVVLLAFGADGLEFRLGYWISDPENGSDNLRSLINLDILRLLREHQIEIPFPQRVIHQRAV